MRAHVAAVSDRSREIRANSLFQVGSISQGGSRHLLQIGDGYLTSNAFGGVHGIGDTVLIRQDSGQSFFY
jgi:hypothetical protein